MLRHRAASLLLFALILTPPAPAIAQTTPRQDPQQDEVVRIGASEVKLDVVVRDKKGHIVKDLQPADFEAFEDGVPQSVESSGLARRQHHRDRARAPTGQAGDDDARAPHYPARRPRTRRRGRARLRPPL